MLPVTDARKLCWVERGRKQITKWVLGGLGAFVGGRRARESLSDARQTNRRRLIGVGPDRGEKRTDLRVGRGGASFAHREKLGRKHSQNFSKMGCRIRFPGGNRGVEILIGRSLERSLAIAGR